MKKHYLDKQKVQVTEYLDRRGRRQFTREELLAFLQKHPEAPNFTSDYYNGIMVSYQRDETEQEYKVRVAKAKAAEVAKLKAERDKAAKQVEALKKKFPDMFTEKPKDLASALPEEPVKKTRGGKKVLPLP